MANKFVWSGATGANDGSSWEDAYTSLFRDWGAESGFTPGTDFVYVRSTHSESQSAHSYLYGTAAEGTLDPVRILSVAGADTGTSPGALTAGATCRTSGGLYDIYITRKLYIDGVEFYAADDIWLGNDDTWLFLEQCRLELEGTNASDYIYIGWANRIGISITLLNTDIDFGDSGQGFKINGGRFVWNGGTLGLNVTNLYEAATDWNSTIDLLNVDLSVCSGNFVLASAFSGFHVFSFERCKVHASATFCDTIDVPGIEVNAHHCQSGTDSDPAYQMYRRTYNGTVEVDTARYRTDGASDGERTNPYSWSMDTSTGSNVIELYEPLESPPITGWTDGDGSTSHTYRIYVASGATLQDDEVWVELIGPNDAATDSLGVQKTTRPDPLDTPANLTTDSSSTWNGTDVTTKQQIDITYTPDKPGPITARICLAKPSERVSVDPKIYIDPS